jgi:D-aminoacyl-tRNA deacylase
LTKRGYSVKVGSVRAVVQRVEQARVRVEDRVVGEIGPGLLVLLGVGVNDSEDDARYISEKIANLRVFDDAAGRMDVRTLDAAAGVLVVSQFTLYGDVRKGRRPSYTDAARGEQADRLYQDVCGRLRSVGLAVATGVFGAEMKVEMVGDGPVTILLDSQRQF